MTYTTLAHPLRELIARHHRGDGVGIASVCSAHPLVLEAAALQARDDGTVLLVEATSNQVDQDGGYTGLLPTDFAALVHRIAESVGLPGERVILGGDHLGPNRWRAAGCAEAMDRAEVLVAAYVNAGFTKIHLDCSMACEGDPSPLPGSLVAERAARLACAAERAAEQGPHPLEVVYVIGTEVPVPGGAQETIDALTPTSPRDARTTLSEHRSAFVDAGVAAAWDRVIALVVQPAVEFDHLRVFDYDPTATSALSAVVADQPGLVFEAHSTDYQTREGLAALVRDHWAVLKVGPGLTFALREALFALAAIENEMVPPEQRSCLVEVLEKTMLEDPTWWHGYYEGDAEQQRRARHYSYSDRSRYYWPTHEVSAATDLLLVNLERTGVPLPMMSQYLPDQYRRVRSGLLDAHPRALAVDHVRDVLRDYAFACQQEGSTR